MADSQLRNLPKEARTYIHTLELQIDSITDFEDFEDDYDHALADQIAMLERLKKDMKIVSSLASFIFLRLVSVCSLTLQMYAM